jgi:hypothetical protein
MYAPAPKLGGPPPLAPPWAPLPSCAPPPPSAHLASSRAQFRLCASDRGPDRFELPASAVTQKLIRALEDRRPAARYFVTTPTYLMNIARRILPTAALDWMLARG